MVLGTAMNTKNNAESFYRVLVSDGCYQLIQADAGDGIMPGADVKAYINQKVFQVQQLEEVKKSPQMCRREMGKARCAMIQVFDPKSKETKTNLSNCQRMGEALNPLGLSVAAQEEHIMSKFCDFPSLTVHFPNDKELSKEYGAKNFFITFMTYLPTADNLFDRTKQIQDIKTKIRYMNEKYLNVRFADPVETPAGEHIAMIKIYIPSCGLKPVGL
jgi:hypothetical protein